jgi:DNA-binding NtrC family response regulator
MRSILLIEDHDLVRISLADELRDAGFQVEEAVDSRQALQKLDATEFTAVITDLNLPGELDGIGILEFVKRRSPNTIVLVITAYGNVQSAVQAIKKGADDYLTKPFETEELLPTLERAIKVRTLESENVELRQRLSEKYSFDRFIGVSEPVRAIKNTLKIVASTDETILIEGETGTGKEVLARVIHENSKWQKGPFEAISCASLPIELLESELFGHEKGAFTGAYQRKEGRFEKASGGTIFLDEVDDIPLPLQVKLLRVLQEKEFQRLGGLTGIKLNARIIAATKKNLKELVQQERFREDLYYRLNIIPIYIPPLRDRRDDILPLVEYFLTTSCPDCDRVDIDTDALEILTNYDWPGNVRQLEHLLKRIIILGRCRKITADLIPPEIASEKTPSDLKNERFDFNQSVAAYERKLLKEALQRARGNKSAAAKLLNLKPSTFRDRLAKYGLN